MEMKKIEEKSGETTITLEITQTAYNATIAAGGDPVRLLRYILYLVDRHIIPRGVK